MLDPTFDIDLCELSSTKVDTIPICYRWEIGIQKSGCGTADHGNYRLTVEDQIQFIVFAEVPLNQLTFLDSMQNLHVINFQPSIEKDKNIFEDALGTQSFIWKPQMSGPFHFKFLFTESTLYPNEEITVIVHPVLRISNQILPPSSICMQTVLSPNLPPFEKWQSNFHFQQKLHYNVIHFTPLQTLGESGSCYSLYDQSEINTYFLDPNSELSPKKQLEKAINKIELNCQILATTDIVLNHTANNSPWLQDHPYVGYTIENSPHLTAAYELDELLAKFSERLVRNEYIESYSITSNIRNSDDLHHILHAIQKEVLEPFKIYEWFKINFDACIREYCNKKESFRYSANPNISNCDAKLLLKKKVFEYVGSERFPEILVPSNVLFQWFKSEHELKQAFVEIQGELNNIGRDMNSSILNSLSGLISYERLQCRKGPATIDLYNSIIPRYFSKIFGSDGKEHALANNGWVMNWDASKDFVDPAAMVYLKRSLVVWTDSVKLRYGSDPKDCPFLWNKMAKYCQDTARIFKGIRLDNCHSTPIHVAKYMLSKAREIQPNLWVYAELFTGRHEVDLYFERELGLHALIREGMQIHDSGDFTSHLFKYSRMKITQLNPNYSYAQDNVQPLLKTNCPAIFFDCTHDNDTPAEKSSLKQYLPLAAAVCSCDCAIASTRGFDEIVPKKISVVNENRMYEEIVLNSQPSVKTKQEFQIQWHYEGHSVQVWGLWNQWKAGIEAVRSQSGIFEISLPPIALWDNVKPQIEFKFVVDGIWRTSKFYQEKLDSSGNCNNFFDLESGPQNRMVQQLPGICKQKAKLNKLHHFMGVNQFDRIDVQHHSPGIIVVQRCSIKTSQKITFIIHFAYPHDNNMQPHINIQINAKLSKLLFFSTPNFNENQHFSNQQKLNIIEGLYLNFEHGTDLASFGNLNRNDESGLTNLQLHHFPPGSVAIFIDNPNCIFHLEMIKLRDKLPHLIQSLSLRDLNDLLYSSNIEELDKSHGKRGVYVLPEKGPLHYCGICGALPLLDEMRNTNFETPLSINLRQGDWFFKYQIDRLEDCKNLVDVKLWLSNVYDLMKSTSSRWQICNILDDAFCSIYKACKRSLHARLPKMLKASCDPLIGYLIAAIPQFYGWVPSASNSNDDCSLAAGLPHFCTQYMRRWGRDTFISLTGLLLILGFDKEAKKEILDFAACVHHALIPNLLDRGIKPRYNSRDTTWFFIEAIKNYCNLSKNGTSILTETVTLKNQSNTKVTLAEVIHLIFEGHAMGISFREKGAGKDIDEHMTDQGFNINVSVNWENGLIYGGNSYNCGTWMDKMGSSDKAQNRGIPATPRDGAAVEINGLLLSALKFVNGLSPEVYKFDCVHRNDGSTITYLQWQSLVENALDRTFFVQGSSAEECIYKDTVQATDPSSDLMLRPNACIALAVAPEGFLQDHAISYLENVEKCLWGSSQIGLKTLTPRNEHYRSVYDNGNDSDDKSLAHGWSFHQGPEWIWPLGYFLRAKLFFELKSQSPNSLKEIKNNFMQFLHEHRQFLKKDWRSLPELTNSNGRFCFSSCSAQSWSVATLLEALYNLANIENKL